MAKKRLWLIEYYRINPITGEKGWDIHFAWVNADIAMNAEAKLKAQDIRFDCVISCSEQAEITPLVMSERPLRLY
jgi:hypothetical protein